MKALRVVPLSSALPIAADNDRQVHGLQCLDVATEKNSENEDAPIHLRTNRIALGVFFHLIASKHESRVSTKHIDREKNSSAKDENRKNNTRKKENIDR